MQDKQMIKELQLELTLMQDALMLSLGAKEDKLDDIAQLYIEKLEDEEDYGASDILRLAKQIKQEHKELFE